MYYFSNPMAGKMGRVCRTPGGEEKCIDFLLEKPEGKRLLGRTRRRWKNGIKMDVREVGREALVLIFSGLV
jgi:hypothetical protein